MPISMNQSYQSLLVGSRSEPSARRAVATIGNGMGELLDVVCLWHDRMRQRRALASLDGRALVDLGLDRQQILAEVEKPFWRR